MPARCSSSLSLKLEVILVLGLGFLDTGMESTTLWICTISEIMSYLYGLPKFLEPSLRWRMSGLTYFAWLKKILTQLNMKCSIGKQFFLVPFVNACTFVNAYCCHGALWNIAFGQAEIGWGNKGWKFSSRAVKVMLHNGGNHPRQSAFFVSLVYGLITILWCHFQACIIEQMGNFLLSGFPHLLDQSYTPDCWPLPWYYSLIIGMTSGALLLGTSFSPTS